MAVFPMPRGTERKIDRVRSDFLWQGNKDKKMWDNGKMASS